MQDPEKKEEVSSLPIASLLKRGEVSVLVVEDDRFLRELLVGKLRKEGYRTIEASDGEEGIAKAQADTPHIILLDLLLPGMGGFEVLERLSQDPKISKIPVIVLSNLGTQEDIKKALELGAKEFMIKAHHTPQEIIGKLQKVLESSYLSR